MARERGAGWKGGRARLKIWLAMKSKKEMEDGEEGERMERKRLRRKGGRGGPEMNIESEGVVA